MSFDGTPTLSQLEQAASATMQATQNAESSISQGEDEIARAVTAASQAAAVFAGMVCQRVFFFFFCIFIIFFPWFSCLLTYGKAEAKRHDPKLDDPKLVAIIKDSYGRLVSGQRYFLVTAVVLPIQKSGWSGK